MGKSRMVVGANYRSIGDHSIEIKVLKHDISSGTVKVKFIKGGNQYILLEDNITYFNPDAFRLFERIHTIYTKCFVDEFAKYVKKERAFNMTYHEYMLYK